MKKIINIECLQDVLNYIMDIYLEKHLPHCVKLSVNVNGATLDFYAKTSYGFDNCGEQIMIFDYATQEYVTIDSNNVLSVCYDMGEQEIYEYFFVI